MKVKFVPKNVELEIQPNQSVMDLAHKNGIFIKSICNGLPSCAECRVRVVEGEHNVLPPGLKELNLIGSGYFIDQRRLSCQLLCFGDITVDLSEQEAKEKHQSTRKPHGSRKTEDETTQAVEGSLIQQEAELIASVPVQAPRQQQQRSARGERGDKQQDKRQDKRHDKRQRRRRRR